MIGRRDAIRLLLVAAAAGSLPAPARAQQSFQRFFPLLPELAGWTAKKPDGMAMEMPGNSMITAGREYQRGRARLNAQIITGAAALGALAPIASGIKVETAELRISFNPLVVWVWIGGMIMAIGGLIVGIFVLIALLIAIFLVIMIFFGGGFVLMKRLFPNRQILPAQQEQLIKLNLKD